MPKFATAGAAGADLRAAVQNDIWLLAGERRIVPTGIAVAIPEGFEMQIRPRSGLAAKFGVTVLNTPGTIDSDYRGEIGVILANFSLAPVRIAPGERIAQAVIAPVTRPEYEVVENLDETTRGAGGFGSTGA